MMHLVYLIFCFYFHILFYNFPFFFFFDNIHFSIDFIIKYIIYI